jgi:excisionase family DNA binding protein
MENLLSVREVARRLGGISVFTVHTWLSQGRLRRTKVGSRVMVRESELERFVALGDGAKGPGRPRPQKQEQEPQQARQDEALSGT